MEVIEVLLPMPLKADFEEFLSQRNLTLVRLPEDMQEDPDLPSFIIGIKEM